MTANPASTNGRLHELDEIIRKATEEKQSLYHAKLEALLDQVEKHCEELGITFKQLIAIANKRKRKARAHKDNGASEE